MAYICQNCGSESKTENNLCNPIEKDLEGKSCDVVAEQVCEDKWRDMKFSCDSCGRISAVADYLCNPVKI